ncbi:cbb3-type cytochrome c oxidase subunit 3 [Rhodoblastus sp.]|jgi:cytochrome c oxidase cbb3-type subunit 4|uniref:cbb3-type cytochrome c oxidase subunit 3 n=1 Tax=Rhodoblastus sp. TaxID=1962975 RepID=UPI0026292987|nr:cbb3-type cytochrome c oxidase subunit 3 [Rhodoblastus sp.]
MDYFEAILGPLKLFSLLSVIVAFLGVIAFALWPSHKKRFDEASRLPLNED